LAIGLRVSLESAERIKLDLHKKSVSTDKHGKELIEVSETGSEAAKKVTKRTLTEGIIKPRLNEIFSLIKTDLEKAGIMNKVPSGTVITGGGALTVGIDEVAKRILSLPTRVAKPKGVKGLVDDIIDPKYAAAVGLILYGAQSDQYSSTTSQGPGMSIKLPKSAGLSKIVDTIKNLLP